jgi:hypothetical protein
MFAVFASVIFLSPIDVVEASINRDTFPKGAKDWNRIGLFKLNDGKEDRLVLLYYYDSDSVADKILARDGSATIFYPNVFSIHAIHQDKTGKWIHRTLMQYSRVRFVRTVKVAPDHLVLECRPNFRIEPGEDTDDKLKREKQINKPFQNRVSFVDSVLEAK